MFLGNGTFYWIWWIEPIIYLFILNGVCFLILYFLILWYSITSYILVESFLIYFFILLPMITLCFICVSWKQQIAGLAYLALLYVLCLLKYLGLFLYFFSICFTLSCSVFFFPFMLTFLFSNNFKFKKTESKNYFWIFFIHTSNAIILYNHSTIIKTGS